MYEYRRIHFYKKPKEIPYSRLVSEEFFTNRGRRRPLKPPYSQYTDTQRNIWHNAFLSVHGPELKSFADVGCALPKGAPSTLEAREYLPKRVKVFAVDIAGEEHFSKIEAQNVQPLIHSIVEKPLPKKVDAVRFAWVSMHLNERQTMNALANIYESLNMGGYLLDAKFILKKTETGFTLIARRTKDLIA